MTSAIQLLLGDAVDDFFASDWGRRARHRIGDGRQFSHLLDWPALSVAVNRLRPFFSAQTFRLIHHGEILPFYKYSTVEGTRSDPKRLVDLNAVGELYRSGATLTIRGAEVLGDPLFVLKRELAGVFSAPITLNLYATRGGHQGFKPHFDGHEIFVLQLEGSKAWFLGQPAAGETDVVPTELPAWSPSIVGDPITVSRGDLLYIPHGQWHYAKALEASLHLTIGVHPATGIDVLAGIEQIAGREASFRAPLTTWDRNKMVVDERRLAESLDALASLISSTAIRNAIGAYVRMERVPAAPRNLFSPE